MPKGYIGRVVTPAEASRRWRAKNPEKVRAAERRRNRRYDPHYRKKWWAGIPPDRKAKIAAVANARITRLRRWLDAYKIRVGCVDCGYRRHPAALHFDHVLGIKSRNVCNSKSLRQARLEIAKCEVRCANCHAVRTFTFYPCKPDIFAATYERVE